MSNPGVRVVVVGDARAGKSSLITAVATRIFPDKAPPVLPPTHLPLYFHPDGVPVTIIDTSSRPEDKAELEAECRKADAVVLTYACDRSDTLDRLSHYWLPELRQLQVKVPIIVVGCKSDQRDDGHPSLEHVKIPLMDEFREIETCMECSAMKLNQTSEVFQCALEPVLRASPFDQETETLHPRGLRALKRICDDGSDGAFNVSEPLRKRAHVSVDAAEIANGLDEEKVTVANWGTGLEGSFGLRVVLPTGDDPDDQIESPVVVGGAYYGPTAMEVDPDPSPSGNPVFENGYPRATPMQEPMQTFENGHARATAELGDEELKQTSSAAYPVATAVPLPVPVFGNGYARATALLVDEDLPVPVFGNVYARATALLLDDELEQTSSTGDADADALPEDEELQKTSSARDPDGDAEVRAPVRPVFGRVFDVVRSGSGNSLGLGGSPDLNQPPPDAPDAPDAPGGYPDLNEPPPDAPYVPYANGFVQPQPRTQTGAPTGVEVIEFDSDDDPEPFAGKGDFVDDSDDSSSRGQMPATSQRVEQKRQSGYRYESSESTPPAARAEEEEEDSDSDDCQVVGSYRPPYAQRMQGAANPVVVDENDDNYTTSGQSSDSSDVEEIDSQSDIRRRWEEAAMRRRMGRAMQSAGSQLRGGVGGAVNLGDAGTESQGLEESVATSTYRDSPDSKDQTETSEARGGLEGVAHRSGGAQATTTATRVNEEQRPVRQPHPDSNGVSAAAKAKIAVVSEVSGMPNVNIPLGASAAFIDSLKTARVEIPGLSEFDKTETPSPEIRSVSHKEEASSRSADQNVGVDWDDLHVAREEGLNRETSENGAAAGDDVEDDDADDADADEADGVAADLEDLLEAKDKLKQTIQYQQTDEAEWASRQQEIQRQAVETQRLRQRKKQEADRKREMERKQKERIEELRLSQKKEERNMDIRDQLRGQVRAELERVAATCKDFATLLRQLGVPVEGGSHPSEKQVTAAYKKALFKFHPDRAVASSQGEPKYQVEAEEKFKLIQRLKDTLVPVATEYQYPSYRSFF